MRPLLTVTHSVLLVWMLMWTPLVSAVDLRIATVETNVTDNIDVNLQQMEQSIVEAAKNSAELIIFPELSLSGERSLAALTPTYFDMQDKSDARIERLAKQYSVNVIYGSIKQSPFEKPFNSAIWVDTEGKSTAIYNKTSTTESFEKGERIAFFGLNGIKTTLIIGDDLGMPELIRVPAMNRAELCLHLNHSPTNTSASSETIVRSQLVARAVENGIWVVHVSNLPNGSLVITPNGDVVSENKQGDHHIQYTSIEVQSTGIEKPQISNSLSAKLLGGWNSAAVDELQAQLRADSTPAKPKPQGNSIIRLALMQDVPEKWNVEKNFDTFLSYLDEADGADIIITPECWLDGYAAPDKASTRERLFGVAQDVHTSPYLKRVSEEAKKRNAYICFGFSSIENGKLFNAAGLWDRQGQLIGIYHKTHIQTHDTQYDKGESLPVWDTEWGKIGIMICADRRWPETARTLRLKGARLILNPTYGMFHYSNQWWMRTRGYENQCFIAFNHPEVGFVIDPHGRLHAKRESLPGVMMCDIDISLSFNSGHLANRRPELYENEFVK